MKNFLDGGEALIEAFRSLGIDYVMSSPGSEWAAAWEALARQRVEGLDGPTYLSCWHETLAVNVAWGYTTATGRVQAVLLHAGAGLLQGAMGINAANSSETPMVILSGESSSFGEGPNMDPGRQWFNSLSVVGGPHRLVEPFVKWASRISSTDTIYESVRRAGEMAKRSPAGPTYMSVSVETLDAEWSAPAKLAASPSFTKPRAAEADIEKVAKLLVESDNPIITTESVGRDPAAFAAMVDLAETLAIPVVESYVTKFSNFPKDHPLHQGNNLQPFLDEVDLALSIQNRVPWYPPSNSPANATVVAIEENPFKDQMVYQSLKADHLVEGDVATSLEGLADAVRAIGVDSAKVAARLARWKAAHDKAHAAYRDAEAAAREATPIDPVWLCAALGEVKPDNAIIVDETVTHRALVQRHVPWNGPHDYVVAPTGLGQGLGISLGIKLAYPERPVISVIGDGAFLYNPVTQALGLAREANLPIMIIVFNNKGYKAMKDIHNAFYPEGVAAKHDLFYGETIDCPDYAGMVAPFGAFGRRVEKPDELKAALTDGLAAVADGKTAIIDVVLTTEESKVRVW